MAAQGLVDSGARGVGNGGNAQNRRLADLRLAMNQDPYIEAIEALVREIQNPERGGSNE